MVSKPEPLRHDLAGYWSRHITGEHRLVYRVEGGCFTSRNAVSITRNKSPHRHGTDGFYAVALERRRETQLAAAAPPAG
jgi:hypothetical protein